MLLRALLDLLAAWRPAFAQDRSHHRAVAQALGTLAGFGRRTLSRVIWALGHQRQDWSADFRLHARADWKPDRLFQPLVEKALPLCTGRYVAAMRLFVVAPIPYQAPGRKRKYYRDPACLLTTDLTGTPRELLQACFDRWQIEVNHREEKDTSVSARHRSDRNFPFHGSRPSLWLLTVHSISQHS
jgi:hypothetical protein